MFTNLTHWLRSAPRRGQRFRAAFEQLESRIQPDATFFALANDPGGVYQQDWSTAGFSSNNNWTGPGLTAIQGFNGNGLAPNAGIDPESITAPGPGALTVIANDIAGTATVNP
ncbi:MAG TPA: hypothetical protein VN641_12430, partial [Urbifossiella sp.]|nr:hypothetical protein [Urbifossiella sp.]